MTDKHVGAKARLTARPLGEVPHVVEFLAVAGLGEFVETPDARRGRNENWTGRTTTGAQVFVKRLAGSPNDVRSKLSAIAAADAVVRDTSGVDAPDLLAWDDSSGVVVFGFVPDATDAGSLAVSDDLPSSMVVRLGEMLRATHESTVPEGVELSTSPSVLPPLESLAALPMRSFEQSSGAELQAWALLQQDAELVRALARLRHDERQVAQRPIHGDLRLDQFLVRDNELWLCDWEEFRWGDAARDLGALIGEFLAVALGRIADVPDSGPVDHKAILRHGVERLDAVLPVIRLAVGGYLNAHVPGSVQGESELLLRRACGFAGWHLIDRLLASAHEKVRLNPVARAVAGIGRTLVLNPAPVLAEIDSTGSRS